MQPHASPAVHPTPASTPTYHDQLVDSRRPIVKRFKRHLKVVETVDPDSFDPNEYENLYLPWFELLSPDDNTSLNRAFSLADQLGETEAALAWVHETTAGRVVNFILPELEARVSELATEKGRSH